MFDYLKGPILDWLNNYAPQGIVITDPNLVICGWNQWLEERSGRTAAEMIGRRLFDAFPEIAARGLDIFYQEALNGRVQVLAHRFHEYLIPISTDFERPLERMRQTARIAPLMENEQIKGTITAIEDVSDRMVREDELRAAREEAEKANRAKDKLLATLSHDLRTPLSSILGWVRLIRNRQLDPGMMSRGLKSIESNALIQLQLLDQILDTSRIASGKVDLITEETDLVEVIETAIEAITPMAEAKNIHIERNIPPEPNLCVVDSKRMHQVFWNLLSNAVKFTPQDGTVRISLECSEHGIRLKVVDSGLGIRPEELEQVFEALWQSQEAGGHGGLGLGLAIAKQLVELHGGSIRAESSGPGQGATFTVDLPHVLVNSGQ